MKTFAKYFNLSFAVLLFIGGLIGYFKAGSLVSLLSSLICSAIIVFSSIHLDNSRKIILPLVILVCLVDVSLLIVFANRLLSGAKLMPALPVMILAFSNLLINTYVLHNESLDLAAEPKVCE